MQAGQAAGRGRRAASSGFEGARLSARRLGLGAKGREAESVAGPQGKRTGSRGRLGATRRGGTVDSVVAVDDGKRMTLIARYSDAEEMLCVVGGRVVVGRSGGGANVRGSWW